MINWINIASHFSWILGCSLLLALVSFRQWEATVNEQSLATLLRHPSSLVPGWLGLTLITIGLAGTATRLWETILWIIISIICVAYTTMNGRIWWTAGLSTEDSVTNGN